MIRFFRNTGSSRSSAVDKTKWPRGSAVLLPQAEAAEEGIAIAAEAGTRGIALQFFAVATAEDHVIGFQSALQFFDDPGNMLAPFIFAQVFNATQAEIVFVGFALTVKQVRQFHGLKNAVHNHRRAKTRAQTEKQHGAALVTPQGLHRGIVDDFDGAPKGFGE